MSAANGARPLLEVEHLTMRFGGLIAVDDVSFTAMQSQITGIIGPNGAGKTTMFNCLTGFYKPTVGRLALHQNGRQYLLEQMEGYRIAKDWQLELEGFNLTNRRDSAIDYFYASQLKGETAPVDDVHFHPVEPRSFRITLVKNW